jgi:pimeloyl-ACP methyl ester carboxylesterase
LLERVRVSEPMVRRSTAAVFARLAVNRPLEPEVLERYASHISAADVPRLVGLARRVLAEISARDAIDPTRIKVPVSLIWGRGDRFCPPGAAARIVAALPQTSVTVFEQAGHCVQLEEPAEVARLLALLPDPTAVSGR